MSIYWRKYQTKQNTELPQTIMRPFWHPVCEKLDDQVFSIILQHEKPKFIPILLLVLSLLLFYISINGLMPFITSYVNNPIWHEEDIKPLLQYSLMLIAACFLLWLLHKMTKPRILQFFRHQHSVSSPVNLLLPDSINYDYDELSGAIECYKNIFGKRKSWLVLNHKTDKHKIRLCYTFENPQQLLGFWSFIVQYMKKDAPLPDVAALYSYPDKFEGLQSSASVS